MDSIEQYKRTTEMRRAACYTCTTVRHSKLLASGARHHCHGDVVDNSNSFRGSDGDDDDSNVR